MDVELVQATLRGDRAASDRFAERMMCVHRILFAQNRRRGRPLDEDELLDVVQDTLAVLWRKRSTFRGEATLETWAYRVAVLEWLAAVRRKRGSKRVDLDPGVVAEARRTGVSAEDREDRERALAGLERLGRPDETIIRHKHFVGLTFEEIGRNLDVSPNTAKYWYYRGMTKLREWLGARVAEGKP